MTGVGDLVRSSFEDCLQSQRGLRPHSGRSYRDTLWLFPVHAAEQLRQPVTRFALQHLTCECVLGFLNWLERERGNSPRTRNQRLAALRGFFRYAATRCPEALAEAQRVEAIPTKRCPPSGTSFLERDELEALLSIWTGPAECGCMARATRGAAAGDRSARRGGDGPGIRVVHRAASHALRDLVVRRHARA